MNSTELLADAYGRIQEVVHEAVDGLDEEELATAVGEGANTVGWLIWHLTRVQDDHIAEVAGAEQIWTAQGWRQRFGLPFPAGATGYGDGPDEVAAVRVKSADLLTGYHDAVYESTVRYVR